jgi:eukaryotic-like serine/threonine-protein kinase
MTPQRHQQITDLLALTLEQPLEQRLLFLEEQCGDDAELRREIESLLASLDQSPSFIETPAVAGLVDLEPGLVETELSEGWRIGHYRIVRAIGQGGMGAVYLAERADEYREKVALKIVKRGMNSDFVLRRFRAERQILASLNHPNIARLLDGGTTDDGLPYFVMEYIEGEPIDAYCDRRKLKVIERLKLFRIVCAAVHYAHQNLVIHRDIKPGNILITADGVPKLLDFGIAKILNPEIEPAVEKTATLMRLMTPEYASPEQARGETPTTATDVYSLGVVLYELLTGHRPYRIASLLPSDIERIICSQEPARPSTSIDHVEERLGSDGKTISSTPQAVASTREGSPDKLRRRLRGDLDNIALMALRKEPQRRYASVEHFSEDLRRCLQGMPVAARPDTFVYRAGKFIRRNRAGVTAGAVIMLSLIVGLVTTVWQARRAEAAQKRAERRFNDVRKLANSYLFEFHDEIAKTPGTTAARMLVVKRALEYLDSLTQESGGDPSLRAEFATAYQKVGDAQGRPGFASIGDKTGALVSYRKALEIRKTLIDEGWKPLDALRDLATNYDRLGDTLLTVGDLGNALASYRQSLAVREQLLTKNEANPESRREMATSHQRVAQALALTGDLKQAREEQHKALGLFEPLAAVSPADPIIRRDLFISYIKEGDLLFASGDREGALRRYNQALPIAISVIEIAEDKTRARRETATAHDKVGNLLAANRDVAGALMNYRAALGVREAIVSADPNNAEIKRDLSISHEKLGNMLGRSGDTAGALAQYRKALEIDAKLSESDPHNAQASLDRASSFEKIGDLLMKSGEFQRAIDHHQQAREIRERAAAADQENVEVRRDLALTYKQLAEATVGLALRTHSRQTWGESKRWYEQCAAMLDALRARGALRPADEEDFKDLPRDIARCEAALR